MRNVFFSDNCESLRRLPYEEGELQRIENFFIRFVPLSIEEIDIDPLCSQGEWREKFSAIVLKKSIRELAELSIQLCKNYYKYENAYRYYGLKFDNLVFYKNMKEICEDFSFLYDVENNSKVRNEIIMFLILSYFYGFCPKIKDHDGDTKKILIEMIGSTKVKDNQIARYRNEKSLFMDKFLIYNGEKFDIKEQSPYDFLFVKSMLKSMPKKNNPFILKKDGGFEEIEIKKMLKIYKNNMSLLNGDAYLNSNLKKIFGYEECDTIADYYNQYIYERLLLVNFLERFYRLKEKKEYPDYILSKIKEFLYCPLLDLRLNIVKFHEGLNTKYEGVIPTSDFFLLWKKDLESIFRQLTKCSLPMTILMFHYLMALHYQNESCGDAIKNRKGKETKKSVREKEIMIKEMMIKDLNNSFRSCPSESLPEFYKIEDDILIPSKVHFNRNIKRIVYSRNYPADEYTDFFEMIQEKGVSFECMNTDLFFVKQDMTRAVCEGIASGRYTGNGIIKAKKIEC